jgi:hypothetical protein
MPWEKLVSTYGPLAIFVPLFIWQLKVNTANKDELRDMIVENTKAKERLSVVLRELKEEIQARWTT